MGKKNRKEIEQKQDKLNELIKALKEKNEIIERKESEIEDLKIEIIKLKEVFRKEQKTIEKQAEQKVVQEKKKLLKEFLEIFDNFERALSAMDKEESSSTKDGVKLIHNQINSFLKQQEVTEIKLEGKQFDPSLCEIGEIIKTNKEKPNTILKILRKGYYLGNEMLRTAVVAVSVFPGEEKNSCKEAMNNE